MIGDILDLLAVEAKVFITAALPILELRVAIPLGVALGLSPTHALVISLLGSMLPVPFILFAIRPIFNTMKRQRLFKKTVERVTHRTVQRSGHKIQKYGAWALIPLVAIPLPGTGVWSGSLAAALLNIRFKWAFPAILLGNVIAGMAMVFITKSVV